MSHDLYSLIEASYGRAQADAARLFHPNKADTQQLVEAGQAALETVPYAPGACAHITATWAAFIRDNTDCPIHAVAGSLLIDETVVFGNSTEASGFRDAFSGGNPDWDGHCWIVFGNLIGDASLFRTAYSSKSPPALKEKVKREFGAGRGLFVSPIETPAKVGIIYEPKYVLTDGEITALFKGMLTKTTGH